MSDSVIIIPTYNEIGNIENILNQIQDLNLLFDVIVVDDNSPDKTGELVKEFILKKKYKINLLLIERESKNGLGSAYIEGFRKSLTLNYKYIFQSLLNRSFSYDTKLHKFLIQIDTGNNIE